MRKRSCLISQITWPVSSHGYREPGVFPVSGALWYLPEDRVAQRGMSKSRY